MGFGYSPFESEFSDSGKVTEPDIVFDAINGRSPHLLCSVARQLRVVECSYLRVIGKIPQDPLHR